MSKTPNDLKVFTEFFRDKDEDYENIDGYNPKKDQTIVAVVVFDDAITQKNCHHWYLPVVKSWIYVLYSLCNLSLESQKILY